MFKNLVGTHKPDILDCISNLSSDEVFTPPAIVNQMLDILPTEVWTNPDFKWLDPATKSGVFLREIAMRLMEGLKPSIPDEAVRREHIFRNMLYGIAITELTGLIARRSLYYSKDASSNFSIIPFDDMQGNVHFSRGIHHYVNGKCWHCSVPSSALERGDHLENHAYQFIHDNTKPLKIPYVLNKFGVGMKFDVIVGNPPYQLNDGGGVGSSAIPVYHKFINQAKKLNPKYISMIIPSRWFSGGRGLDEFRDEMLNDNRIRVIHDYMNASDCFPGVEIKGGVCYFLWNRDSVGQCDVYTHNDGDITFSQRNLLEDGASTFIRHNDAISIFYKVRDFKEKSFSSIVSANDPFGFDVRENASYKRVKPSFKIEPFKNGVSFYYNGWRKDGLGYVDKDTVKKNKELIEKVKILVPKAWGIGDVGSDWVNPFIIPKNSCCTETYLVIGPFDEMEIAENVLAYTQTKFFHFLVSLLKITQNTMKKSYEFVPMQDFSSKLTDDDLYKKYKFNKTEIDFIESMVRSTE